MHELVTRLREAADPDDARALARYFQVKPGGYGEGDVFLGVRLSCLRRLARPHFGTPFEPEGWLELLTSDIHEHRLVCLVVMAERAGRLLREADPVAPERELLLRTYLSQTEHINNWDLVDVSAGPVVGGSLLHSSATRKRAILDPLAQSPVVWERRIAVVSQQQLIQAGRTADVYRLAAVLLEDPHDLIHKAMGWMLREAGLRCDELELRAFLDQYADRMPRTMLRYAIERFPAEERQHYRGQRSRRTRRSEQAPTSR